VISFQDFFKGSVLIGTEEDDLIRNVQVSSNKNKIVFYDADGGSYLYDFSKDSLVNLPVQCAAIVWSSDGNEPEFISNQYKFWAGMGSINIFPHGLYLIDINGNCRELIDPGIYVKYVDRKKDGVYFDTGRLADPLQGLISGINRIVFNPVSGEISYTEFVPYALKPVFHENINAYSSVLDKFNENPDIFISGNYALAPYNNTYARYDLKSHAKKLISRPIGIYAGYFYYFDKPISGGVINKMNIANLSHMQKLRAYAKDGSSYISGNLLYYLNPQKDAKGSIVEIPYSENLDNHKLTKLKELPNNIKEYHIFKLSNGNKICYTRDEDFARLEDKNGKFIRNVGQYYKGYIYNIEKTADGKFDSIVKLDINGETVKTIYKVSDQYASISSYKFSGDRVYFVAGGNLNLYSCSLNGTNLIKY
jgi:hypothetical protein